MAKVSIIIPVYNVEKFIGKCTQSLLAQTLDDMEVFFVDDHCPDNSMEVARQCVADSPRKDQFHFIQTPHNMGAGMARNRALSAARSVSSAVSLVGLVCGGADSTPLGVARAWAMRRRV